MFLFDFVLFKFISGIWKIDFRLFVEILLVFLIVCFFVLVIRGLAVWLGMIVVILFGLKLMML